MRILLAILLLAAAAAAQTQIDRSSTAGRQVRVAAITIGMAKAGDAYAKRRTLALSHLETAGKQGVDIALLPEEFASITLAETVPGNLTDAVAATAKKYNMYIICPLLVKEGSEIFNSAVLIGRDGSIAGSYHKQFPFWNENVNAPRDTVRIFDTDFGRIAILICFDANFDELWFEAEKRGAEVVFWPSAYNGGLVLNAHARASNYWLVPAGRGNFIDCLGKDMTGVTSPRNDQYIATLDLDLAIVRKKENADKVAALLAGQGGDLELLEDTITGGQWQILRSTKTGVEAQKLCAANGIETLREYRARVRASANTDVHSPSPRGIVNEPGLRSNLHPFRLTDRITIMAPQAPFVVDIFSLQGRMIKSIRVSHAAVPVGGVTPNPGTYIARVRSAGITTHQTISVVRKH